MKILLTHNYYQLPGGEDVVFETEAAQLESHGHSVVRYVRHNDELKQIEPLAQIRRGLSAIWSCESQGKLEKLIALEKPDVAHFHNAFPLLSPSAYIACKHAHVPVVQTLHNYRMLCPAATLLRDGHICEDCATEAFPISAVVHRCYRGSYLQSVVASATLSMHRLVKTWKSGVSLFIALSEFSKSKFARSGIPRDKILVKPNCVGGTVTPAIVPGTYALFVGRLSPEKGLKVLINAWKRLPVSIPLQIVGDGPLRVELETEIRNSGLTNIQVLGQVDRKTVRDLMRHARFLVCPSQWYEGFPLVVAESFACGVPVLASRIGALAEIVTASATGLHFDPHDAADLASKVQYAQSHPAETEGWGKAARKEYLAKYTEEKNYESLLDIYRLALKAA